MINITEIQNAIKLIVWAYASLRFMAPPEEQKECTLQSACIIMRQVVLTLDAGNDVKIQWHLDAAYAVHPKEVRNQSPRNKKLTIEVPPNRSYPATIFCPKSYVTKAR